MPPQDSWKFTCVLQDIGPLGPLHCPVLTPLLRLITPSRALGTADHVRSLDDLLYIPPSLNPGLSDPKSGPSNHKSGPLIPKSGLSHRKSDFRTPNQAKNQVFWTKQGRIRRYPSRVHVGWGSDEGHWGIWAGAVSLKYPKTPKK